MGLLEFLKKPAGAPAIASSTGKFVAGNPLKRLASASTIPHTTGGSFESSPDEMQIESAWRIDAHKAEKSQRMPPFPSTLADSSEGPTDGDKVETPKREVPGESTEAVPKTPLNAGSGDDDISLGYSPGSTQNPKAKPLIPNKQISKFDKYYHQRLAGIQLLHADMVCIYIRGL